MTEKQVRYRDGDHNDGAERKHGVVREGSILPGILVARPVGRCLFDHRPPHVFRSNRSHRAPINKGRPNGMFLRDTTDRN